MAASGTITTAQFRLANYYLTKLRIVEAAYHRGHEHSTEALALLDQEWSQIKRWRAWSAEHARDDDEIANLCQEYPQAGAGLFLLRQHPRERLEWLEAGLEAVWQLGNTRAEIVHLFLLGRTHSHLGTYKQAQDFAGQALALAQQVDDPLYECRSLWLLGTIFYRMEQGRASAVSL